MTRFNNKYPYTDFHELNADWLLETVKDAAAEAQEASDTVATYNDRLTTVEGDLAPIKAAMPGLASDVSGLKHDVGVVDSLITNTINPELDTLKNEVETPSTGLLDRMTAAEGKVDEHDDDINNIEGRMTTYDQDFVNINNALLSDQRRINSLEDYRAEAQVKIGNLGYSIAPLFDETAGYNAGDYVMSPTLKLYRARVNIPAGTANINDLTQFMPTDINNALGEVRTPFNITAVSNVPISNVLNYSYYTEKELVINVTIATTAAMSFSNIALNTDDTAPLGLLGASTAPLMACGYANPSGNSMNVYSIFNVPDKQIVVECSQACIMTIYGVFARS